MQDAHRRAGCHTQKRSERNGGDAAALLSHLVNAPQKVHLIPVVGAPVKIAVLWLIRFQLGWIGPFWDYFWIWMLIVGGIISGPGLFVRFTHIKPSFMWSLWPDKLLSHSL
jgi:hypothetical protein